MTIGLLAFGLLAFFLGIRLRLFGTVRLLKYFVVTAAATTATYFLFIGRAAPEWYAMVAVGLVALALGYSFHDLSKRLIPSRVKNTTNFYLAKAQVDFRVKAVMVGLIIAYIMSFYFFHLENLEGSASGFWFSFYTSWISGLVLFSVVGLVVALVSLYRPERDVFDVRIKILTGGRTGPEIDNLAGDIRKSAYFAKKIERKITFERYDESRNAVLVRVEHVSHLENIFHDVPTSVSGQLSIQPDRFEPPFAELGRVSSFRVNRDNIKTLPIIITEKGMDEKWSHSIPAGSSCEFGYEHQCWYDLGETHEFVPARYTKELQVSFRSRCELTKQRVKLNIVHGNSEFEPYLGWDASHVLGGLCDLPPQATAYRFRIPS